MMEATSRDLIDSVSELVMQNPTVPRHARHPDFVILWKRGALQLHPYVYVFTAKKWPASTYRKQLILMGSTCVHDEGQVLNVSRYRVNGTPLVLEVLSMPHCECNTLVRLFLQDDARVAPPSETLDGAALSVVEFLQSIPAFCVSVTCAAMASPESSVGGSSVDRYSDEFVAAGGSNSDGGSPEAPTFVDPEPPLDALNRTYEAMLLRIAAYDIHRGSEQFKAFLMSDARAHAVRAIQQLCYCTDSSVITFHFSLAYFDRYAFVRSTVSLSRRELQSVAVACFNIACKNIEVLIPSTNFLLNQLGDGFTPAKILELELHVLSTLRFKLHPVTTFEVAEWLLSFCGVPSRSPCHWFCCLLCDLCAQNVEVCSESLTLAAVGIVYCALYTFREMLPCSVDIRSVCVFARVDYEEMERVACLVYEVHAAWFHTASSTPHIQSIPFRRYDCPERGLVSRMAPASPPLNLACFPQNSEVGCCFTAENDSEFTPGTCEVSP